MCDLNLSASVNAKQFLWWTVTLAYGLVACVTAWSGEVTGKFHLDKENFCVGEPIVIEFTVFNETKADLSFNEGSDYRGTLCHHRYSIQVTDAAGNDVTQKQWGDTGGIGRTITLQPDERFKTYLLLNGWTHLLAPGKYLVNCKRILSLDTFNRLRDEKETPKGIAVEQQLAFEIGDYNRNRVLEALKELDINRTVDIKVKTMWTGKPIEWAYADLANKFQMGLSHAEGNAAFAEQVVSGLPTKWDDMYFVEYTLESNRNWLTAKAPEDYVLTFSARNNSNKSLDHGFMQSRVALDGKDISQWPDMMKAMLKDAKIGNTVQPRQTIKLTKSFNDVLNDTDLQKVTWKVQSFTMETEIRVRR